MWPNETETPFSTSERGLWKTIMEMSPTVKCVFYSILAYTSGVPRASVVGFPTVFTGVACLPIPQHRMQIPTQAMGLGGQRFLHHLCSLQKVMRPCVLLYLNSRCGKPIKGKITGAGSIASYDLGGNFLFPSLPMHGSLLASDNFSHWGSRCLGQVPMRLLLAILKFCDGLISCVAALGPLKTGAYREEGGSFWSSISHQKFTWRDSEHPWVLY